MCSSTMRNKAKQFTKANMTYMTIETTALHTHDFDQL